LQENEKSILPYLEWIWRIINKIIEFEYKIIMLIVKTTYGTRKTKIKKLG